MYNRRFQTLTPIHPPIMKKTLAQLVLLFGFSILSATPLIIQDYESLNPGDPQPDFPGVRSNYPGAVLEIRAETPGAELFGTGNTRYFRWESLTGINPDPAGSGTQFYGGASDFIPFPGGSAQVISAGFDFIVGPLQSELLFGIGEPPAGRQDDQNYGVQLRLRGVLGLGNRPEVVGFGATRETKADIQEGVPYRLELVANKSGATIAYESPLGPMTVDNERYDIFLLNKRTNVLQLIIDDAQWKNVDNAELGTTATSMEGFWWGTFRYDGTGRAVDFWMDNFAIYHDDIILTGHEWVPSGPATAIVDFDDESPAEDITDPLWNLPGNIVADTSGLFGANNATYFHINRRNIPEGVSNKFRFNGVVELVSFGFDLTVNRDPVITSFSDAHDEGFIAISGGDTIANAKLTSRINIRGTRSVGNDGNPAEADPLLNVVSADGGKFVTDGFDWETPYRIEVVMNQTGETITYNTPWADDISLADEHLHLYLYNYAIGKNVAEELGRKDPFMIETGFLNGRFNPNDTSGIIVDMFWKHVTGRRLDLSIDNVAVYENTAVVTNPGAIAASAPGVVGVGFIEGQPFQFQSEVRNRFTLTFTSESGLTYGLDRSSELDSFTDTGTIIPADASGDTTTVELPIGEERQFFRLYPIQR
jgi:hypothetical protein